ncbi:MAG TPA: tRNA (adenosine(37)-N6)-threonylcarbamoyltransferase complex ATPase subunit type 1 TsaE [Paracoccaceae bacterium]|nr:tRNA (adenosine(37)-N6)-threonylcarbamoyltransferase complex ATPase subunit type 1 TsaE [Paracoccaceae bacterium]
MTSDARQITLCLPDAEATRRLAERIAPLLRPGDVLLLDGPIGAGKTHFCRSLIQARLATEGRAEDVPSPTFTLVQTYLAGGTEIWHADLYRLSQPDEITELGLEQAFDEAICLVEWPDRLGPLRPPHAMVVTLTPDPVSDARKAVFAGDADHWSGVFHALEMADD